MARDYSGIAVVAPTSFGYAKASPHPVPWFAGGALRDSLRRAGLRKDMVDGLIVASYRLAPDNAASLAEMLDLSPRFLADLPYGGAAGVIALRRAARAVQAGDAEVVACLGADVPPKDASFMANFSSFSRDEVHPYGAGGANGVFALITDHYMRRTGATREDFGRLCIAQRTNASHVPGALLGTPLSMQDYLAARPVAGPLRLFDCVLRCCGGEGFLVMSADRARALGLPWARIAGAVERHHGDADAPVQTSTLRPSDRDALWTQAGRGPQDMGFAQVYDDYPVIVLLQLESLGFCEAGEGVRLLRERDFRTHGDLPVNTSGGMLSLGQAGAAGGFLGLTEALRQVTGEVVGARATRSALGVVSGYGTVSYDRGVCSAAAVLERGA